MLLLVLTIHSGNCQNNLGLFDNHMDVGSPENNGFAYYQPEDQTYLIGGSGKNMWFDQDQFHYLWTTLQGDFIVRAEIDFKGEGVDPHRKVGWIVKNDLNSETPHVNASTHGDGLTSLQYRKTIGGNTEELTSKDSLPDVIQLERRGDDFIMSTARFGEAFISVELKEMNLKNQVFIGLYVCSHNPEVLEVASFRNVRIIKPAAPDFEPYRDYLGSRLEVMDVSTGHRKVRYATSNSIQAPNWTPDGEHLLFNSEGRLYQYSLKDEIIRPLNTGFAINNNNDHVLSFDGSLLGISDHNPDDGNTSTIYYLPAQGDSLPIPVTKAGVGASYLHGWSPDNREMLFTGDRKGQYDIYSVNVNTGKEKQLTNQNTLDDGSEYSPDGKHILFNSARTGKMKIWRMDPEGENQTQLTFDEYNDWFPHVSPDQKWIVFISFPKDIDPNDHPFYKHCLLRIIPFEGGSPKIIGYLYGGQGSINVPSWSPDSQSIFLSRTQIDL